MNTTATDATRARVVEAGSGRSKNGDKGSSPERLPAGSHGIPRALIEQNQRERLIAAAAEVSAEHGYSGTTIRKVSRRAGVSNSTFYQQFQSLEDCMIASFWNLHGRLMEQLDVACRPTADAAIRPRLALRRSLELFAADVPTARLMTVEILGAGEAGARAQHEGIRRTAQQLEMTGEVGWGIVAMVSTLIGQRVIAAEAERIPGLEDELDSVLRAYAQTR